MKVLGTTYTEIEMREVIVDAAKGSNVFDACGEAVQLACQLKMPVILVHNEKRYPISVAKILEGISPEKEKGK